MLSSNGFDLWADGYDKSVSLTDESGEYPFAGYRDVLGYIYSRIRERGYKSVLDIGFGTAVLASRLYRDGTEISGVDFSPRMLELARIKMPYARLYPCDFTAGLPTELYGARFDCIVATYSLHHLEDAQKPPFIKDLLGRLAPRGEIMIGDVAFEDRRALEACRARCGGEWDDEEAYFVFDELKRRLAADMEFLPLSHCAGVLHIAPQRP